MFFIGVIFTALVAALVFFVIKKGISVRWYEWLIAIIGLLLLVYTIQNFMAAFGEEEPAAAWLFWLFIGLPSLIIIAIPVSLVFRRLNNQASV